MPETVDLLVHRRDHRRVAMAEARHPDAAAEIEDVASVDGMQVGAFGGLDHEVRVAVVRRRDELGVALTPGSRVGGEHAGHEPDAAAAGPAGRLVADSDPAEREEPAEHDRDAGCLVGAEDVEVADPERLGSRETRPR